MLKKIKVYIIPIVLIVVVFFQMYNVRFSTLHIGLGGGFGMFASGKLHVLSAVGYTKSGDSIVIDMRHGPQNTVSFVQLGLAKYFPREKYLKPLSKKLLKYKYVKSEISKSILPAENKFMDQLQGDTSFYYSLYTAKLSKKIDPKINKGFKEIVKVKIHAYAMTYDERIQEVVKIPIISYTSSK